MDKKIVGIFGVTLILIGALFIQPAIAKNLPRDFEETLFAVGFIRIDSEKYEISGFVLTGMNEGKFLFLKQINIVYDGTTILVTNPMPLIFNIKYNPA